MCNSLCISHTSRWVADEMPGRSETTDLIVEITLQPWNSFRPDGLILFRWIAPYACALQEPSLAKQQIKCN